MGNGKWIWPKQAGGSTAPLFCVVELCREYQLEKEMELVSARVTADTFFSFSLVGRDAVSIHKHLPGKRSARKTRRGLCANVNRVFDF